MKCRSRILAAGLAAVLALPVAVQAKSSDFLLSKKFYGAVSLGVSLFSFKAAYDAKKDAGDFYDLYEVAYTAQTAQETYDESKRHDTKAALLLGVGIGTLAYSVHAFLSDGKAPPPPKMQEGFASVRGVRMDITSDPYRGGVKLSLKKGF
jgi:hypothetical protein